MCLAGGPCALAQDDEEVSMPVLELDPERAKGRDGRRKGMKFEDEGESWSKTRRYSLVFLS